MFLRTYLFLLVFFCSVLPGFAQMAAENTILSFGQVSLTSSAGTIRIRTGGNINFSDSGAIGVGHQRGVIRYSGIARERMSNSVISVSPLVGPGADITVNQAELRRTNFRLNNSGIYDMRVGATIAYNAGQAPGHYVGTYSVTYEYRNSGNAQTFIGTIQIDISPMALVIAETDILDFATLSIPPLGTSVVEVDPNGNLTVLSGAAVPTGSPNAGGFDIEGTSNSNVFVSFASSANLTNGTHVIVLDNLIKNGGNSTPINLGGNGRSSFTVGGNLTLPSNLSSGTYSGIYTVTVNY